jgi:hypothetical protein
VRAFGLDINLTRQLAMDAPAGSVGVDGDSPFTDLVAGGFDRTPEMSGTRKWMTINEMRQTDAMIRSILYMYWLPIRSADWGIQAADDDPTGIVRDATARQFGLEDYPGQLDLSWLEWLQQTMLYIVLGSLGEEYVYSKNMELWDMGPGDDEQPRDPLIIRPILRMAPRFPSTVDKITIDKPTGKLQSIRQGLIGNGPEILAEWQGVKKLEWYVHEREGANWWGQSLLRAMYGPWRLKKSLMIAAAIGWDRYSSGVPVVRYPKGAGSRAKREAEQAARNYRTHERAWITFEGTEAEGWKLDIIGGSQTLADPTPLLQVYNEEMATAGLQIFTRLGSSHHGSRAVGEVLADPYYLAVQSYAKDIAAMRMRGPFRAFVDINFGTNVKVPILSVSKIQAKNILVVAQAIQYLAAAGLNFTDRDTQNDLRDQMDLRHLPEPVQQVLADNADIGIEETSTASDPFDVPAVGVASPASTAAGFVAKEGDSLGH